MYATISVLVKTFSLAERRRGNESEAALGVITKTLLYLSDDPELELGFYPGASENLTEEALAGYADRSIQLEETGYPRISFLGKNVDRIHTLAVPQPDTPTMRRAAFGVV
jgi:hypothetical protein